MLPLLIRVANKETGASIAAGFRRSPVRLGRNHLNDLAIDESFVSQWHGIVRFDETGTRFLDLGSTNGTKLGGERLEKNVEIDIEPETRLAVGPLRLTFERAALTDEQILPRRASAFTLGGTSRPSRGVGAAGTVELGSSKSGVDGATLVGEQTTAEEASLMKAEILSAAARQRELMARIEPLHQAYEAAHSALLSALVEGLADAATETEKRTRATLLEDRMPVAFEHPAIRRAAGLPASSEQGGGAEIKPWLERLAPGLTQTSEDPSELLERAGAALEAFAASFVDLRAGQKQIRHQLGVEDGSESSSLPTVEDSRELVRYLLDGRFDSALRLDELARSFADLALHQMGIVNGAIDGTRAVLAQLSPHAIGAAKGTSIAKTSFGFGDFLWPFAAAANYYRFASAQLDLATRDKFTAHLFGSSFARAYYRITGKR